MFFRDQKQIISTLRQENSELRHRLKQLESRAGLPGSVGSADLAAAAAKSKKHIEALRRELGEAGAAYDKLRHDCARELAKSRHELSLALRFDFFVYCIHYFNMIILVVNLNTQNLRI